MNSRRVLKVRSSSRDSDVYEALALGLPGVLAGARTKSTSPLRATPRGYRRIALGRGEGLRIHRVALSRRIPPVLVRVLGIRWPAWQAIARLSLPGLHTGM